MKRALVAFETFIIKILLALMMLTIAGATVDLVWVFIRALVSAPFDFLTVGELLDLFGLFMIVLIGLELLDTVKTFVTEQRVHVEAVLLVALIAVTRKVILLDLKEIPAVALLGIAAVVLAVAGGYALVRRADVVAGPPQSAAPERTPRD